MIYILTCFSCFLLLASCLQPSWGGNLEKRYLTSFWKISSHSHTRYNANSLAIVRRFPTAFQVGLLRFVSLKFDSGRWYRKTRYPNVHTLFTRCIHNVCTIWSIHTKQEPIFALATLLVFVHTGDGLAADSSFGNIRLARKMTKLVLPQFSLPAKQIKFLSTEII